MGIVAVNFQGGRPLCQGTPQLGDAGVTERYAAAVHYLVDRKDLGVAVNHQCKAADSVIGQEFPAFVKVRLSFGCVCES